MSRFIEYSNNILFFDVMFGETLNKRQDVASVFIHFSVCNIQYFGNFLPKYWNYIHLKQFIYIILT